MSGHTHIHSGLELLVHGMLLVALLELVHHHGVQVGGRQQASPDGPVPGVWLGEEDSCYADCIARLAAPGEGASEVHSDAPWGRPLWHLHEGPLDLF